MIRSDDVERVQFADIAQHLLLFPFKVVGQKAEAGQGFLLFRGKAAVFDVRNQTGGHEDRCGVGGREQDQGAVLG